MGWGGVGGSGWMELAGDTADVMDLPELLSV